MRNLVVAPVVEGHGEYNSIRILLVRLWREICGGEYLEVIRPVRRPRSKLVQEVELKKAVEFASLKLQGSISADHPGLVLILLDANSDPACVLGPKLLAWARQVAWGCEVSCVLANPEYESWFVASAESLTGYLDLSQGMPPAEPERSRSGKKWIEVRYRGSAYSETVDQPAMTAMMSLDTCRARSPSFDKLCREMLARCT